MAKHLYGMTCATITPMLIDGSVDYASAEKLYEHLAAHGVHCLYPNGTNGESLSLTQQEREQLADLCVNTNNGRAVVYIQCGASTVGESYSHVHHAKRIGADGAGLMTPFFFPVDEQGLEAYYCELLDAAKGYPVYIYNIAARTGNDVSVSLFQKLMERYDNLLGMKFSSPDLLRLTDYVCSKQGADVLIGCDHLALPCLTLSGVGYVSGPGAAFPDLYVSLYEAYRKADLKQAEIIQRKIHLILKSISGIPEIPAIKYLLMKQGLIATDVCRAPLRLLTAEEKARLDRLL